MNITSLSRAIKKQDWSHSENEESLPEQQVSPPFKKYSQNNVTSVLRPVFNKSIICISHSFNKFSIGILTPVIH